MPSPPAAGAGSFRPRLSSPQALPSGLEGLSPGPSPVGPPSFRIQPQWRFLGGLPGPSGACCDRSLPVLATNCAPRFPAPCSAMPHWRGLKPAAAGVLPAPRGAEASQGAGPLRASSSRPLTGAHTPFRRFQDAIREPPSMPLTTKGHTLSAASERRCCCFGLPLARSSSSARRCREGSHARGHCWRRPARRAAGTSRGPAGSGGPGTALGVPSQRPRDAALPTAGATSVSDVTVVRGERRDRHDGTQRRPYPRRRPGTRDIGGLSPPVSPLVNWQSKRTEKQQRKPRGPGHGSAARSSPADPAKALPPSRRSDPRRKSSAGRRPFLAEAARGLRHGCRSRSRHFRRAADISGRISAFAPFRR